jgi:uncharacterized membrane protein
MRRHTASTGGTDMPEPSEEAVAERSTGRLFGLADGVFAIAMTLLALDLRVPELGDNPTNAQIVHQLGVQSPHYWSFLLSFYVIAGYWRRHRTEMASVTEVPSRMTRVTLTLLLLVTTMPFAADLLGSYGSEPIAVEVYAVVNALAIIALLVLRYQARLTPDHHPQRGALRNFELWFDLGAFALAIPASYVFPSHGLLALLALNVISGALGRLVTRWLNPPTTTTTAAA